MAPSSQNGDDSTSSKCQLNFAAPETLSPFSASSKAPSFDLDFHENMSISCSFPPRTFLEVMENLIKNPNITSSQLFRADIFYDSLKDASYRPLQPKELHAPFSEAVLNSQESYKGMSDTSEPTSQSWSMLSRLNNESRQCSSNGHECLDVPLTGFARHMKASLRPVDVHVYSFLMTRTIVLQYVPRNPQRDKAMVQTCHIYEKRDITDHTLETLVVYIPHLQENESIPFYFPKVRAIAFLHSWKRTRTKRARGISPSLQDQNNTQEAQDQQGSLSIHTISISSHTVTPCPSRSESPDRLQRTLQHLLTTIHKHGTSRHQQSYTKKAHHDLLVPQDAFQNTYTRLKLKYSKSLVNNWKEVTDPTKHVFEDLGIAAFCIELWGGIYSLPRNQPQDEDEPKLETQSKPTSETENNAFFSQTTSVPNTELKPPFPGFIDLACGNGLLVHILLSEGYDGWGFDARKRRSWTVAYPPSTSSRLREMIFIPDIFSRSQDTTAAKIPTPSPIPIHNGHFLTTLSSPPPFLISNHADQLTLWTPLLSFLNNSAPFLAIPCCSHDFSGRRFRSNGALREGSLSLQMREGGESGILPEDEVGGKKVGKESAFASLTRYLKQIATVLGLRPEEELLRIPSTRNRAIVSRYSASPSVTCEPAFSEEEGRLQVVKKLVEVEMAMPIEDVAQVYFENVSALLVRVARDDEREGRRGGEEH